MDGCCLSGAGLKENAVDSLKWGGELYRTGRCGGCWCRARRGGGADGFSARVVAGVGGRGSFLVRRVGVVVWLWGKAFRWLLKRGVVLRTITHPSQTSRRMGHPELCGG